MGRLRRNHLGAASAAGARSDDAHFPIYILGFHSDTASEFLNYCVAALLENCGSLNSPSPAPAASTDNALVEIKNRAILRKYIGCGNVRPSMPEAF